MENSYNSFSARTKRFFTSAGIILGALIMMDFIQGALALVGLTINLILKAVLGLIF